MSYSSCGEADGGNVASCAPAGAAGTTLRICDAGAAVGGIGAPLAEATAAGGEIDCVRGESLPATVDRSSGAPAARPPGAPTGGALSGMRSGVAMTAGFPNVRGEPGAPGFCDGSNTSERRPGFETGGAPPGP